MRFDVNNGVALCWKCHLRVNGHEAEYEEWFDGAVVGTLELPLIRSVEELYEREILRLGVEYLRRTGWLVFVFAEDRAKRKAQADWVDAIALRYGVTLLVEAKSERGELRPGQVQFMKDIEPHLAPTLRYVCARNLDDFVAARVLVPDLSDVAVVVGDSVI